MSILIKGIEMPKSCDECEFHVYHSFGEFVCVATPMFYPMNLANCKGIRKDWCPLIEVPHHGRLIDADALYKQLDVWYPSVIESIENAPTIIEAEEAERAEWYRELSIAHTSAHTREIQTALSMDGE